ARMQRLGHGRLAALCPPGGELWLDGGHNADGGRAIANALADLEERVSRPLVLVVGMLSTKDCESFLKNFAGLARRVVAGALPPPAASPMRRAGPASPRRAPMTWGRRSPRPAASVSSRRRASSSPARFISRARCLPPTARRRSSVSHSDKAVLEF